MKTSERRAKIMATLGPASRSRETLRELLRAGLDVVRLNLSHGTHDEHRKIIRRVREVAAGAPTVSTTLTGLILFLSHWMQRALHCPF